MAIRWENVERRPERADVYELVQRANEVPIADVLDEFFMIKVATDVGDASMKMECPFGIDHADGGMEKAWRVFVESNYSYCWGGHGPMNPVKLIQLREEVGAGLAAKKILERFNLMRAKGWRQRAAEILVAQQQSQTVLSVPHAVAALQSYAETYDTYSSRLADTDVTAAFEASLVELEEIASSRPSDLNDVLSAWFVRSRRRLEAVL